ncbi:MAG: hypothetical protein LBJ00_18680 [Planctomycetaceae bacterium]|nr:hypothetical protein [Planctomycetaceae bacterium]
MLCYGVHFFERYCVVWFILVKSRVRCAENSAEGFALEQPLHVVAIA